MRIISRTLSGLMLFVLLVTCAEAQDYYWIGFRDKKGTPYSISEPEKFLSERSIQRRIKQNIPVDERDLPVSLSYIDSVRKLGVQLVHSSKWLNGITVRSGLPNFRDTVLKYDFVREVQLTKPGNKTKSAIDKFKTFDSGVPIDSSKYGGSVYQIGIMNGQYLHNNGYFGQGKVIAVLDAGFYRANLYPAFDSLWISHQILGTRDFVNPSSDIFLENSHGMSVLSAMGGNIPGSLIGTAPEASYWLIRSEDGGSEYLIEEDNWVVAAEFADSVGADIINSSLGYYEFDDPLMNHSYQDMDGNTTRVTQAANIAFSRGMLVVASAGNERNKSWHYIIAPSDGDNVIAVAAVNKSGQPSSFTSAGPASDGEVKPNVAAIGWGTVLQGASGTVVSSNGTSFSSPVLAGMAACLWQSNPDAGVSEIKSAIEQSAHLSDHPDTLLGYGIPDFKIADLILKTSFTNKTESNDSWEVFPNPFTDKLLIHFNKAPQGANISIKVTDIRGTIFYSTAEQAMQNIVISEMSTIPAGIYILHIKTEKLTRSRKIIKIN